MHAGFQEAAQGLWELLAPELRALERKGETSAVAFTGHSLGGATAQLCALAAGKERVAQLVTFGGPLIGRPAVLRGSARLPCVHCTCSWHACV